MKSEGDENFKDNPHAGSQILEDPAANWPAWLVSFEIRSDLGPDGVDPRGSVQNRGTQNRPQYIMILATGTPKKGSLIFGIPPPSCQTVPAA